MHKPNTYLRIRFSQVNRRNYFQRSKKKKKEKRETRDWRWDAMMNLRNGENENEIQEVLVIKWSVKVKRSKGNSRQFSRRNWKSRILEYRNAAMAKKYSAGFYKESTRAGCVQVFENLHQRGVNVHAFYGNDNNLARRCQLPTKLTKPSNRGKKCPI